MKLLTVGNTKTRKGEAFGYLTHILHLAPSWQSGFNTCPMASKGCTAACLNTSGLGRFANVQAARTRKTLQYFNDRETFMDMLASDIHAGIRKADREGLVPTFRLNGTSDIRWENVPLGSQRNVMSEFSGITFYDYTAIPNRRDIPDNYHLTFSRKEDNEAATLQWLANGGNAAVVFDVLPETWNGYPVIDATVHDLRFLDPRNVVAGLTEKGKAADDLSGFVVRSQGAA